MWVKSNFSLQLKNTFGGGPFASDVHSLRVEVYSQGSFYGFYSGINTSAQTAYMYLTWGVRYSQYGANGTINSILSTNQLLVHLRQRTFYLADRG